jgi:predicted transcriptional regulator
MRKETVKKLKAALKKTSILQLSKDIGIPYATLYRIVHGGDCNTRNWDKIERHYR